MAHGPDSTPGAGREIRPGSRRGTEGFFQVAQLPGGQWTLFDPAGAPWFARAANDVRTEAVDTDRLPARHPAVRLREWGFNAVGPGGDGCGRDDGLAYFAAVNFTRIAPLIAAPGIRLPDVFAPDWPQLAAAHAALACEPHLQAKPLIAWVSDDTLAWGEAAPGRPGLLQVCLSLEPTFAAYHAAWEFVLALHGGSIDALAAAWGVALANKEVVRELTRTDVAVASRGYLRDEQRWTREFARRYFGAAAAAIRAVDPNHLICSARCAATLPVAVLAAAYPTLDLTFVPWLELPPPGAVLGPILAGDVCFVDLLPPTPSTSRPGRAPRLTTVEILLRRARTALRRLARHPAVIGYTWRQWEDAPGELPPFAAGLVHPNGVAARTNVELVSDFNARLESLRRAAAKQLTL